jgi:hypothetical protein
MNSRWRDSEVGNRQRVSEIRVVDDPKGARE